jgi:predicted phosphodiesterase
MPSSYRVGVIADIHGNVRALEAVLDDLREQAPDVVVNLGDHLSGPLWAAETADLLMSQRMISIRGNHDRQLLDRPVERMGPSDRAAWGELRDDHKAWLAALAPVAQLDEGVFLCHGSPASDLQYLLEEVSMSRSVTLRAAQSVAGMLTGVKENMILCGHTHIPRVVQWAEGRFVINPGSVGLPAFGDDSPKHYIENGSPDARYGILDRHAAGWRVSLRSVAYDWREASARAAAANRPDWAHALATGYALHT